MHTKFSLTPTTGAALLLAFLVRFFFTIPQGHLKTSLTVLIMQLDSVLTH